MSHAPFLLKNIYTELLQKHTSKQQILYEIKRKIAFLQSFPTKTASYLDYFLPKNSHILVLFPDIMSLEIFSLIKKPIFFYLPFSFSKKIHQKNIFFFQENTSFSSKLFDFVLISPEFFYKKNSFHFEHNFLKQIPFILLLTQEVNNQLTHSQEYQHFIQYMSQGKIITEKGIFSPHTFHEEIF